MPSFNPLVSIVITTYNHFTFIRKAIESAVSQSYLNCEVIVIDDGSTDKTADLVKEYRQVNYYYQSNQGLSAARNKGIDVAKGEYILFLDADDWLYPLGVETNVNFMQVDSSLAFVCGAHDMVNSDGQIIFEGYPLFKKDVYRHLLFRNYLAMHASVLFRKTVLEQNRFDTSLGACEDYDLYLRITRNLPVKIHDIKIAAYRQHSSNMSLNTPLMLESALKVLNRQKKLLRNKEEILEFKKGKINWKRYYVKLLYREIKLAPRFIDIEGKKIKMGLRYLPHLIEIWLRDQLSGPK